MRLILLFTAFAFTFTIIDAQVRTNINNDELINVKGKFKKSYAAKAPYRIPPKDIKALLEKEMLENVTEKARPFKIAEAIPVDIDVVQQASWVEEGGYAHGSFTIIAAGAKSISVNFDQFKLPKGTELYEYSESEEMITGPVT